VAEFAATHSPPVVTSTDSVIYAQQNIAALAYWKAVPLEALYGQYGCTVSGEEVRMQVGGDGVTRATAGWAAYCPPGIDANLIPFVVLPRTDAHVAASSESSMEVFAAT
jgi:hypothetical protein